MRPRRRTKHSRRFWPDDVADEKLWCDAKGKGALLVTGMKGTDKDAGQLLNLGDSAKSPWTGDMKDATKEWQWYEVDYDGGCGFERFWKMATSLNVLGLSTKCQEDGGDNINWAIQHGDPNAKNDDGSKKPPGQQYYKVDNKEYRVRITIPSAGVISTDQLLFAQYLTNPLTGASQSWGRRVENIDHNDLPKLRQFSSLLWAFWDRGNPNIKNLRYFWVNKITNDETNKIIARVLEGEGGEQPKELRDWPGEVYDTSTEKGQALLGSPIGAGYGFFLMQHKAELGNKYISKVRIFIGNEEEDVDMADPDLLFYVDDVPPKQGSALDNEGPGDLTHANL
ncbi:hypothetical protein BDV96DRAFT_494493 [Lophiotrema nucula]|uniref:Uncharacterized protein n=1 Tax=Lophiotrema nucula TaxID=690887 RepID=A0A6A5Z4E4_9PLEO|nr:hypothetical protein BDV96DRAFT_494493 [Lophiotrema nucula]